MFLVLLSPLILPSQYWNTERKKTIIILFSLIIGAGEIWLNTINSQFYLCLFSVYILLSETNELRKGWAIYCSIMLLIAAMTGVTSVILLPFFALKIFSGGQLQKFSASRVNWIFFLILTVGLLIQISVFYFYLTHQGGNRFDIHNHANFALGFANTLLWIAQTEKITGLWNIVELLLLLSILYSFYHGIRERLKTGYLIALIIYISSVFTLLSEGMSGGSRYAYPVSVLIVILLIQQAENNDRLLLKQVAYSALLAIALLKIPSFFYTGHNYDPNWDTYYSQASKALSGKQDFIRVYPQWPGTRWWILLPRKPKAGRI